MTNKHISQLFFIDLAVVALSIVVLWVLNNHFLRSIQSNHIAVLLAAFFDTISLLYVSYLSFKERLVTQGFLILVLTGFVALGMFYLYVISGIGLNLQNANFTSLVI